MATDRLKQLRIVDPVLTSIARGYKNAAYISEALFPVVSADKEGVTIPMFGKEAFRLYETERAIRAKSNVMTPDKVNSLDVVLHEHDLSYPIDYRESHEDMFDSEARATRRVKDALDLRREKACATLAQNPNSYNSNARKTLTESEKWSDNGGDPIKDVEDGKEIIRQETGVRPNTVVMGAATYQTLKFHQKLQEALGSNERKLITLEHLQVLFGIDRIFIGEAIAGDKKTSDVWGDNLILSYTAQTRGEEEEGSYEEPSFGYTLRLSGMPETDTYDQEGGKLRFVRHTDIYKPVIVGKDAGYLIIGVK